MAVMLINNGRGYLGVAADPKPSGAPAGSKFYETDTGTTYIYTGSSWVAYTAPGGGGTSLPDQTGNSGKFLTTDGSDASWGAVSALPSQTGQSGKYLTTNGSAASWGAVATPPSITYGAVADLPATCKVGDMYRTSDSIYDFLGTATNVWTAFYQGQKVTRPPSAGWTWDNQDSAVLDSTNGYEYAYFPRSGAAHISVRYRTAPTPPYFIIAGYLWNLGATPPGTNGNNLDVNFGLFFRDGDDGKIIAYTFGPEAGTPYLAQTWRWTNSTTRSTVHLQSSAANLTMLQLMGSKSPVWMAIADDGTTNLTFWWSIDRQHWELFDTWAREDFMTGGPTQVAWGAYNGNGPQWDALIDWTEGAGAAP